MTERGSARRQEVETVETLLAFDVARNLAERATDEAITSLPSDATRVRVAVDVEVAVEVLDRED